MSWKLPEKTTNYKIWGTNLTGLEKSNKYDVIIGFQNLFKWSTEEVKNVM